MQKHVIKIHDELKQLKIQGASNVRKAIVQAISETAGKSTAKTAKEFRKEISTASIYLLSARPTEPEARNAARIILHSLKGNESTAELRTAVIKACDDFELNRKKALEKIAEIGEKTIPKNAVIFTHCHSHTVEEIISLAARKGKIKRVIATETRPKMQGHITAENLSRKGIKCTLIVDSAASSFMKEADIALVGADAIQADGSVVNKIGTKTIALIAENENVPLYVCTSSFKFDPETVFGKPEEIEERNANEIWGKKMKNLEIRNPAFDVTNHELIEGIISELGVLAPETFAGIAYRKFAGNEKSNSLTK